MRVDLLWRFSLIHKAIVVQARGEEEEAEEEDMEAKRDKVGDNYTKPT